MTAPLAQSIRKRVETIEVVPSNMAVLLPLLRLLQMNTETIDINDVVSLVSYDNAIAAQCLRVAASPLFGVARPPNTISKAVVTLGLRRVESILLTCCMGRALPVKKWCIAPVSYWRHTLGCAMICRKFCEKLQNFDGERAYVAGLLHDIGFLVNCIAFPDEFAIALDLARRDQIPLDVAELATMGFTHCDTGQALAVQWKLSEDLAQVITWHHSVYKAEKAQPLVAIVHLCDLLCRMRNLGYGYYERLKVDMVSDPAWGVLLEEHRELEGVDLVQFTFELDEAMTGICELVSTILAAAPRL
jgi:putative nucleotidyltransferase with HDIG domain